VADYTYAFDPECVQQCEHVGSMVLRAEGSVRLIAFAEPAQIGRNQPVSIGQACHDRFPRQPQFGPTVKEQQRRTVACLDDVKGGTVRPNHCVFHPTLSFGTSRVASKGQ
jgi:hypothetical protein